MVTSSSLTFLPPSFTYKDPCDSPELIWIVQDNLRISKSLTSSHLQSLFLPCKLTYSQVLWINAWSSLGSHYSTYHRIYRPICDIFFKPNHFFLTLDEECVKSSIQHTSAKKDTCSGPWLLHSCAIGLISVFVRLF